MSLSNALSNAANSLLGSFVNSLRGVGNGTNPLIQPQVGNLLGINIPATPLISTRDYFLAQLNTWVTTPSLQSQWICVIDAYPQMLNSSIMRNLERTAGINQAYDIDLAKALLTSYPLQRVAGCIFVNVATVPQESFTVENATLDNNRGFIPGIVGSNREGYAGKPLTLSFLETNTSFVDFVLRPWTILASHYGLVRRKDERFNITCNIILMYYAKTYQNVSMIPRKIFRYYNCVPTTITQQQVDYVEKNETTSFDVNFAYTNYTVENNLYFPLPQIIKSITTNNFKIPTISPFQV